MYSQHQVSYHWASLGLGTLANQEMEKHWNILDLFILFIFFLRENDVDARASVPLSSYATGFLFFGKKFDALKTFICFLQMSI
jgi:hypothetical protein